MKTQLVLLLTQDPQFKTLLSETLLGDGGSLAVKSAMSDAFQMVCSRGHELDLVVLDFDEGCHGMTLLSAIKNCRDDLPIIVATSGDVYHAAAVAYANGVDACLAKPVSAAELRRVVTQTLRKHCWVSSHDHSGTNPR
jgi:FOG: CheY-like receiver